MDRTDKHILDQLQHDGRLSNQALADEVALSSSPCLRQVKQLEDEGYIDHYVAILNLEKLGLQRTIFLSITLDTHDPKIMSQFEKAIQSWHEVVQCHLIAGQAQDYLLKVIAPDLDTYHAFLMKKITQLKGISNINSSFKLRTIVDNTALPLNHLK